MYLFLQILKKATLSISHINDLIIVQATNVRDISWNKANQILDTHYGSVVVKGLDSTAVIVDKLIDRYFPATEEETAQGKPNHTCIFFSFLITY